MSLNLSTLLKLSVAGAVLFTVGACKPADKGQGALKSKGVSALNLSKSESGVFAKYFVTDACEVDEMEALGALAGLGMGESGANGLSFDAREVSGGLVTYRNLSVTPEDGQKTTFSAKSATFHCPKMGDENPSFARVDMSDILVFDAQDGVTFTAETLNLANPTSQAARSIVGNMIRPDSSAVDEAGFGAISVTGAKIASDDMNGTVAAMSWGEIRDDDGRGTADLTIEDVDFTVPSKNGKQNMTLKFGGMSVRNMNVGGKIDRQAAMSPDDMISSVLGNINAFVKPYDELIIEEMTIDSEGFAMDFGGIEGKTSEKSGVVTTRQTLKPSQIRIKPAMADNAAMQQQYNILKSLNFETMDFSGSAVTTLDRDDDSISVSDGLFEIQDALRLNYEYEAEGLSEMAEKMKGMSKSGAKMDLMAAYEPLKLRGMRFTMEDNSIVSRGLKLASEMTGQDEKTIKRSLGMAVFAVAMAAENDVQAEVYTETVEAFADFVKNGGTLTIEANPPAPFPLAPLMSGKGADIDPDALGFSASRAGGDE